LVTGGYERNPAPFGLKGIPRDFKYQLLPPIGKFYTLMENSINAFRPWNGGSDQAFERSEGFTPDGEFLLGPTSVKASGSPARSAPMGWPAQAHWQGHGGMDYRWHPDGSCALMCAVLVNYNSQDTPSPHAGTYTQYYDITSPAKNAFRVVGCGSPPPMTAFRNGLLLRREDRLERPNWFKPYEEKATTSRAKGWSHHNWSRAIGYEHLMSREMPLV